MNITMKQLKFLTMALAMVLGLTMTSCLDSDEGMPYYTAIVKVNASYLGMGVSFETNTGYTIEPSQASYLESISNGFDWDSYSGQLILLGYSYDEASPDVTVNDDGVSGVNLLNMSTLNSKLEIVNAEGAANDSVSNMPIIGLGDDATIKPAFWDEETLLLPINYFMWDGYTNPL